jgi:hypothetical protein
MSTTRAIREVIQKASKPLHITQIVEAVRRRGCKISDGSARVLVWRLTKAGEAECVGQGLYQAPQAGHQSELHGAVVYFMQVAPDGPIKIGWTKVLSQRLSQVQTTSPHEIRLLATTPGDDSLEGRLHKRFAHLHLRGEWFSPAPELLAFISSLPGFQLSLL